MAWESTSKIQLLGQFWSWCTHQFESHCFNPILFPTQNWLLHCLLWLIDLLWNASLQQARAWGDAISWTCGWNWSWAIGKTAGEEKTSRPKSGNLHLWKHSDYNSYNSSVIQVCSIGHKKCFLDASFWFCSSFSNGEQLLTKYQRKQNKILPQFIWYLHSCKIQYIGKQWKALCFSMKNSVRFYFR